MAGDARRPKGFGAISLALGGIASGFLAAACCALPMLLASTGLGSAWLVGIAVPAAPYRLWFVAFGAISLVAGGVLLALLSRLFVEAGAQVKSREARRALLDAVGEVTAVQVVEPIQAELDRLVAAREVVAKAR